MTKNTIYALSTLYGTSAIAIIRVCGDSAFLSFEKLCKKKSITHNKATLSNIYDESEEILDKAIIIYFPKEKSYNGEDIFEYHIHGSTSIIKTMLEILSKIPNHRLADRGEFTKIALLNNKINLLEAESLLDLIHSQTPIQRKQALRGMLGDVNKKYNDWYNELLESLAEIEATIDFSDQDLPENLFEILDNKIIKVYKEIQAELNKSKNNNIKQIREGFKIAILGAPNVGKSSLINYLSSKDVAIVSQIAGTTRDVIEVFLDINGFPALLYDSAGIRITNDEIENKGIAKAIDLANQADIKIVVIDANNMNTYEEMKQYIDKNTFILLNKIDLVDKKNLKEIFKNIANLHFVSIKNQQGLSDFKTALGDYLATISGINESPIILQSRHKEIIQNCEKNLYLTINEKNDIIIKSFHLRNAINNLSQIFGKIDIEEVLGLIFNKFCIGK